MEASRRRCATKVFRRASQQKLQSAPVDNWDVITPFHFFVRYEQKVGEMPFFPSASKFCKHTTSHSGSGSSQTHLVLLRHTELFSISQYRN